MLPQVDVVVASILRRRELNRMAPIFIIGKLFLLIGERLVTLVVMQDESAMKTEEEL